MITARFDAFSIGCTIKSLLTLKKFMAEKEIGKVVHYFDKASVAVVKLLSPVSVGDTIKIKKGEDEFTDTVESMQIEHESITSAKAGEEAAIKISQKTKEGAVVYKLEK